MGESLSNLLVELRNMLSWVRLSLPLAGASDLKQWSDKAIGQLDDYIGPRLKTIEAPLLTVVGGSTGAGKSTLVNSLVGREVTPTGVIRPTTKTPVLIHNPVDAHWFETYRVFPDLTRITEPSLLPHRLQTVASLALPEGLAILDAPDIDSVDVDNRHLAAQLLSAADLWLFVTSAARYADALPWDYLDEAVERSTAVGIVVDRVPPAAMSAVPAHLAKMMTDRGLGESPLFAVPETVTNSQGMLPFGAVAPIRSWLDYLASNQITRARVVMGTLNGAIAALEKGIGSLTDQVTLQNQALKQLWDDARSIYAEASRSVHSQISDGTLLRGEVLARWQDYIGTGDFMRTVETTVGRLRDRVNKFFSGDTTKAQEVSVAVKSGLESLVIDAGQAAAARVSASWLANPAGRHLLAWAEVDVGTVAVDFPDQVDEAIRRWQDDVLAIVSQEGADKRSKARLAALGVNAVGVCLMLVVFAHTAGVTGAEIGIASGTAVVAQKILELIFGDEAIRRLATTARDRLGERIDRVLDTQLQLTLSQTLDRFPAETIDPAALLRLSVEIGQAREQEMQKLENLVIAETEVTSAAVDRGGKDA